MSFFLRCRQVLPVLVALCLALICVPGQAFAVVSPGEVCQSSNFAPGCSPSRSSSPPPIFWVPPCPVAGDPSLLIGTAFNLSRGFNVSILYNRHSGRRLQLNGTSGKDIVVGSPGVSDIINGGPTGDNAYVVAGGTSTVGSDGSSVISDGASTEVDRLNLTSTAADFINIKPNGQGNPGTILVPRRCKSGDPNPPCTSSTIAAGALMRDPSGRLLGEPLAVRGSDELKLSSVKDTMERNIGLSCPMPIAMASPSVALAAGGRLPIGMVGRFTAPLLGQLVAPEGSLEQTEEMFPGVPDLQGLNVDGTDVLVLSAADFPEEQNFPGLIDGRTPIPIEVVNPAESNAQQRLGLPGMATILAAPIQVSPVNDPASSGNARKASPSIRSKAPLVYFSKTGLLVLSKNSKPLGSESNPGRVIARLLTAEGAPLKLKAPAGRRFHPARFVLFTSSERPSVSQPKTPTTPAKTTTYGATSF